MNLQELRTKLLEEFEHVGWLESCKGSCQGKRKPQKSSDSSSCLRAGSPRVPVPHRHLHCTAIPEGCWAERDVVSDETFVPYCGCPASDASRRVPFYSMAFYSNSHSVLWIFCNFFFLHCQDFCVKRRCRKARRDQLRRHDLAQLTVASCRAVASHTLICTELKIPQKLVVLATLLRKDWKVQCFVKTVKDKHCRFPSFWVLAPTNTTFAGRIQIQRGNWLLLALPTDWKAHAGKSLLPENISWCVFFVYYIVVILHISVSTCFDFLNKFLCWFFESHS